MKTNKQKKARQRTAPKIRILRLMNGSLRPWRWQMTFYLFLFRPQLAQRAWRWQLMLSANQCRVSFERISQAELLSLRASHPSVLVPGEPHLRLVTNKFVTALDEPEVEIIPLTPVWREAA